MVKDTTLYDRLEIPPNADESQIKKAYIKLSKQWHPDKHDDDHKEEATVKFIKQKKLFLIFTIVLSKVTHQCPDCCDCC